MFLLVVSHPLGMHAWTLSFSEMAWVAGECVLLQITPLLLAVAWYWQRPGAAVRHSSCLFALMPIGFAVAVLVFRGSGMHLASSDFREAIREHLPRLIAFFSWGMLVPLLAIAVYVAIGIRLSKLLTWWLTENPLAVRMLSFTATLSCTAIVCGSLLWLSQGRSEMLAATHAQITRHPFNLLGLNVDIPSKAGEQNDPDQRGAESVQPFTFDLASFSDSVSSRMRQMRMNVVIEPTVDTGPAPRPDVLIIICESLRSEMLAPDIVPHTFAAARSGWWLRQHYSGGNATSLGIFSLVSGLESIWFYRSEVRFAPALNRLFRQAGYELGFFAGHDDWGTFQMDAFLSPRQYDRYETEPMDWLASDRRSIAKTVQFLRKPESPHARPPRLAVLFLYSTHTPFDVADAHARDQPAASADYPIPYPQSWRGSVWNRYRNAARSLDAELAEVLQSDAVIAMLGDHGESFLDDGTIGHGTKLSRVQTRTAAMICAPHLSSREIRERTTHMDVLPTLLGAAGIELSLPGQFDGLNLETATLTELQTRTFSISNLVGRDLVLVPPATRRSGATFGTRVEFSLLDNTISPRGAINAQGNLSGPGDRGLLRDWMEQLVR
ncbi:Sulfatase [Allorhodopirellula heiligendammensis]|uniref:Sulfatase n=2 Tax=Allorhodopirellula heiligendammensis TaxID=2714739 RepID=A0A5C6BWZ0_9BACT|nr:Sulfatase [Allorhodopirellula heiligendammensis]